MNRAGQLDLALDVDDVTAADADTRGNARRATIGDFTELDDGEAVDLTDDMTVRVNQHHVVEKLLQDTLAYAAHAPLACTQRLLNVRALDALTAEPARVLV